MRENTRGQTGQEDRRPKGEVTTERATSRLHAGGGYVLDRGRGEERECDDHFYNMFKHKLPHLPQGKIPVGKSPQIKSESAATTMTRRKMVTLMLTRFTQRSPSRQDVDAAPNGDTIIFRIDIESAKWRFTVILEAFV